MIAVRYDTVTGDGKQDQFGPIQTECAGGFAEPGVPADLHPDFGKVKLEDRIIMARQDGTAFIPGEVAFAVPPHQFALTADDDGGVVDPSGACS